MTYDAVGDYPSVVSINWDTMIVNEETHFRIQNVIPVCTLTNNYVIYCHILSIFITGIIEYDILGICSISRGFDNGGPRRHSST